MRLSSDVRSMVWTRTTVAETVLASMADYRQQVGARIRQLRLARGLTQDQLADLVGVQEKTVSRWEKGRHSGYMSNIKALAEALEVDPEDITGTPPAPLGLGARADQLDDVVELFGARVDAVEARLAAIEQALRARDAYDEKVMELLDRQSKILEGIETALNRLGVTEDTTLPDRLAQILRDTTRDDVPPPTESS